MSEDGFGLLPGVTLWDEPQEPVQQVKRRDMDALYVPWQYICGNQHILLMHFHDLMHYTDLHILPCGCSWKVGIVMSKEQSA